MAAAAPRERIATRGERVADTPVALVDVAPVALEAAVVDAPVVRRRARPGFPVVNAIGYAARTVQVAVAQYLIQAPSADVQSHAQAADGPALLEVEVRVLGVLGEVALVRWRMGEATRQGDAIAGPVQPYAGAGVLATCSLISSSLPLTLPAE